MSIRLHIGIPLLMLCACQADVPQAIEQRLAVGAGQIRIGDKKELAVSKLAALDLKCHDLPVQPARPGINPDIRFSLVLCTRVNPSSASAICSQSVELMILDGRVNRITIQTNAVGGAPPDWTCSGR